MITASAEATAEKKRVCILSFSPIRQDARVLRQIEYLFPFYDLTVIGYGSEQAPWPNITWHPVPGSTRFEKIIMIVLLFLGRLHPAFYVVWYWQKKRSKQALAYAQQSNAYAFHANEWATLPIAVEAARDKGAKVIFDAHEYSPSEQEDVWWWRFLISPMVTYLLHTYTPAVDVATTVCVPIAERYKREFGFEPIPVFNAPQYKPRPARDIDPYHIRLIHHGSAIRDRHLEWMIQTLARLDQRFSLHFMLVGNATYIQELRNMAERLTPGRVEFIDPVIPQEVIGKIEEYDIGFYLLAPSNYNNSVALPNKFFDFIIAGLAICVGPSPTMADLVRQYQLGCVSPNFEPEQVAAMLNGLSADQIRAMRQAARETAKIFNADTEMAKVTSFYHRLLNLS